MKKYIIIFVMLTAFNLGMPISAMQKEDIEEPEESKKTPDILNKLFNKYKLSQERDEVAKIASAIKFLDKLSVEKKRALMDDIANEIAEPSEKFDKKQFNTFLTSLINNYTDLYWLKELDEVLTSKYYKATFAPDLNDDERNARMGNFTQFFSIFNNKLAQLKEDLLLEKTKNFKKIGLIIERLFSHFYCCGDINNEIIFGAGYPIMKGIYKTYVDEGADFTQDLFHLFISRVAASEFPYILKLDIINSLLSSAEKLFRKNPEIDYKFKDIILAPLKILQDAGSRNENLWNAYDSFRETNREK